MFIKHTTGIEQHFSNISLRYSNKYRFANLIWNHLGRVQKSIVPFFQAMLKLMVSPEGGMKTPGVMIPIPQYPLYSASLAEYNMQQVYIMELLFL